MQVKKFIGESLPQALLMAKRQLGEEVVLLESKEVDGGIRSTGQTMVEITVGIEEQRSPKNVKPWTPPKIDAKIDDETPPFEGKKDNFTSLVNEILTKKPQQQEPEPRPRPEPEMVAPAYTPRPATPVMRPKEPAPQAPGKEEKQILNELSLLRQEISQLRQNSYKKEKVDYPSLYAAAYEDLVQKGVDERISDQFIKRVYHLLGKEKSVQMQDVRDALMMEMNQNLMTFPTETDPADRTQKVILLLGATGVGKSTTAMKLAAHPDIFGKKDVAIISVDPYGPSEALKSFSRMNGTTVHEEKNVGELKQTLTRFKSKDVIIIDTPGKSPFAPNHLDTLENYIQNVNPTDIFLVLGMNADIKDLYLTCAMYLLLKPTGVIFTKFDETTQPGKVFSVLDTLKLPVVCFCNGKRIFIDIELANIEFLYSKIFDEA